MDTEIRVGHSVAVKGGRFVDYREGFTSVHASEMRRENPRTNEQKMGKGRKRKLVDGGTKPKTLL